MVPPLEPPRPESIVEAMLLGSPDPLPLEELQRALPPGSDATECLRRLSQEYEGRSLTVVRVAGGWTVRAAGAHAALCRRMLPGPARLPRAALETLATIAIFQPVTRPEIERIRGVSLAKGTLDLLVWAGLVRPAGRRAGPGNPLTFVTTDAFLRRYALDDLGELPEADRWRSEGILDPGPALSLPPAEADS